ncbi:unnamed protein product [Peniophora sp. CBMAI 1063]|nr:unnamed protein product [Peniophora sp. CBMAI 1063]
MKPIFASTYEALSDASQFAEGTPDNVEPEELYSTYDVGFLHASVDLDLEQPSLEITTAPPPLSNRDRERAYRACKKLEGRHISKADKELLKYLSRHEEKRGYCYTYNRPVKVPDHIAPYAVRNYKGSEGVPVDALQSERRLRARLHRTLEAVPKLGDFLQVQCEVATDFIAATMKRLDAYERAHNRESIQAACEHARTRRVLLHRAAGLWQERELLEHPTVMYTRAQKDNLIILLGCP